ncbi:MAG: ATP-binding cassette subfamily F protein 3 [Candidatus Deianiraeaceae bacterium]|jgi:ATP-binding cassette subfamily F protein 3
MISAKGLTIEFGGRVVFGDADFIINDGEKIGLIGRNGSGKSTLFKLITGEHTPSEGTLTVPEYCKIGYLDQHLKFTMDSVVEDVCSVLEPEREYESWKGEKILTGLGFTDEQMLMNPKEFSGGYQIKINLAKLLLMDPDILLLDEPTNYLDIASIRWLGKFLKKWDGSLVLITHDRSFMDSLITHTMIIHRNQFRKISGKTAKIKDQIAVEEEIYEKTRVNEERERAKTQALINRFKAKASKAAMVQSRIKMLDKQEQKVKLSDIETLDFHFNHTTLTGSNEVVAVKNLTFGYTEGNPLIENLSFTIKSDDKVCVIGKNGKGKSTLLQLLAGSNEPLSGSIGMHSKVEVGYFGQMNIDRLHSDNSICEEMETVDSSADYSKIRRTCANMLFPGDLAHKKIAVLSGGEKSRVMLGKILLTPVNLLLLDEPTNHFDMESCESLMGAIKGFKGATIMVTHNEYFLHEIATKLIVFDGEKTFLFEGTYASFLKKIGW